MSTHHDLWLLSCTRRRSIVFWVHSPKLDCGLWHWISLDPLWLPAVSPSSSSPWSLLLGHHKCRTKLRYCRIPQGLDCTPCKQWSWWQLAHWEKNWQLYLTIEWILFNPPYFLAPENIEFCIYMPCFLQSSTIIIHIKKALLKRVAHSPKCFNMSTSLMRALDFFNPAFYNFSLCDDNFSPIHHNFSPSFLTCPVQNAFFTPPYKHHFGQCERA